MNDDTIYNDPKKLVTNQTGFIEKRTIDKPWGSEELIVYTEKYAAKFLNVNAGELLSIQYHNDKMETLMVVSGRGKVLLGNTEKQDEHEFSEGMILHIMPGTVHTFKAEEALRLLEISTPEIWDVVRLKDKYGRGK